MAEQFTLPVKVGGSAMAFAPNPLSDPHIEWSLRYAGDLNNPQAGRFSAAAVMETFAYLLSDNINMTEATRILRVMRAAVREHVSGVPAPASPLVVEAAQLAYEASKDPVGVAPSRELEPRMYFCPACFVEVTPEQAGTQTNAARVLAELLLCASPHDPHRNKSNAGRWVTINAPRELVDRARALGVLGMGGNDGR